MKETDGFAGSISRRLPDAGELVLNRAVDTKDSRKMRKSVSVKEADLPADVRAFRRKFREWEESFRDPAERMKFIRKICQRIADDYQPEKIILFGSHAYGTPTPDSDIDLLIVMKFDGSPAHQAIKISNELGLVTPMDLLIRTPEQIASRLRIEDGFIKEILDRGKIMYEAKHG